MEGLAAGAMLTMIAQVPICPSPRYAGSGTHILGGATCCVWSAVLPARAPCKVRHAHSVLIYARAVCRVMSGAADMACGFPRLLCETQALTHRVALRGARPCCRRRARRAAG
eukprot:3937876-Rhodomonas_salina.7